MVAVVAKADLGILEGRVDARGRRDEPRANPLTRAARAVFAMLELPRLGQRFDRINHAPQPVLIAESHLLAIGVAVASNERQTVRTRGVGPPVAAIADVIVRIAGGRRLFLVNNRGDGKLEGFVGIAGNSRRVQSFYVEQERRQRFGGGGAADNRSQQTGEQHQLAYHHLSSSEVSVSAMRSVFPSGRVTLSEPSLSVAVRPTGLDDARSGQSTANTVNSFAGSALSTVRWL